MNISLLSNIITSFFLTYMVIPPIVRVSLARNLMDVPNNRKLNKKVIPTLGGVAIFIGLNLSSILFVPNKSMPELRFLYAGVILMFFIGLKDDLLIISARKKLAVQILAALLIVVLGKFQITQLYGFASINYLNGWLSIPLSVMVVLFLINAINLIDGIDGLASGIALLFSSLLGIWFYLSGFTGYGVVCMALAGSLLAFLRFNLWGGRNKIFMGDTGSLILGIFMAALIIKFNELNVAAPSPFHIKQAPLIALALLIVPITDTLRVFTVRIFQKRSPFSPDMNHIHHLLIKARLTHIQASSFLIAYSVFFLLLALTIQNYMNITVGFFLILGLSFSFVGLIKRKSTLVNAEEETPSVLENGRIKIIQLHPSKEESIVYNFIRNRRKLL